MIRLDKVCQDGLCRPGGYIITDRAMTFCCFEKGAKLADIGCGSGATVRYIRQNYGIDIFGIDKNPALMPGAGGSPEGGRLLAAEAEKLPFGENEMDGLLFECSLSKMKDPIRVLGECARVLRTNGYLIISDLYARGEPSELKGLLGRVDTRTMLENQLTGCGFSVKLFEDYTCSLKDLWGQVIFEYGAEVLYENLGIDSTGLKSIKCGYCLIIARKEVRTA